MSERFSISLFAAASLLPAACVIAAALVGGNWVWAAFLSMTALVFLLDRAGIDAEANASMSNWLPNAVACAHFAVLGATVWAIGRETGLDVAAKLMLVLSAGLFVGQVSNACAHELIHRKDRLSRLLGTLVYCSILNGQHVSAHMLVHHVHSGTANDPNSAPKGRGFYRFLLQASMQEFIGGWRAETKRRRGKKNGFHPYMTYLGAAAASLFLAFGLGGGWGVGALLVISAHALVQLMMSDYVQHYGLRRQIDAVGKIEPMGVKHSWNAPQRYSGAMMLNATRHSDHHTHPGRSFAKLRHDPSEMPTLPYSLPVMGALALAPPLWRRVMDPRVENWAGP